MISTVAKMTMTNFFFPLKTEAKLILNSRIQKIQGHFHIFGGCARR